MNDSEIFDRLGGCTIIEHRAEGPVVGRIEYAGRNGDGSVGIGWSQYECGNRTTVFSPQAWKRFVVADVLFFERTAKDEGFSDLPWETANNYTVVMNK